MKNAAPHTTYSIRWKKTNNDQNNEDHRNPPENESVHPNANESLSKSIKKTDLIIRDSENSLFDAELRSKIGDHADDLTDIEEAVNSSNTEYATIDQIVPLERFKKKGKLSVTDLSAQLWCEKQLEFQLITGKKRFTEAMKKGVERHSTLELLDHDVLEVEVETAEDNLGLRLLNSSVLLDQLKTTGKAREIWIFGSLKGVLLTGIVDEIDLRVKNDGTDKEIVITDTKTRSEEKEPSVAQMQTSALQLQLYRWMINELRCGRCNFNLLYRTFQCDPHAAFQSDHLSDYHNLVSLASVFTNKVSQMATLANYVEVVYECNSKEFSRKSISYSEVSTLYTVNELFDWWIGFRTEAAHVLRSEKWKCKWCSFVESCEVTPLAAEERAEAAERVKARDAEEEAAAKRVSSMKPPPSPSPVSSSSSLSSSSSSSEEEEESQKNVKPLMNEVKAVAVNVVKIQDEKATIREPQIKPARFEMEANLETVKNDTTHESSSLCKENFVPDENRLECAEINNSKKLSSLFHVKKESQDSNKKCSLKTTDERLKKGHQQSNQVCGNKIKFRNRNKQTTTQRTNQTYALNLHNWLIKQKQEFQSSDVENHLNSDLKEARSESSATFRNGVSCSPSTSDGKLLSEFNSPETRQKRNASTSSNKKLKTW